MPVFKLEEGVERDVLPADAVVQVECTDIKMKEVPASGTREAWNKLEFTFEIIGLPDSLKGQYGSLVGSRIWGSCGANFSTYKENKLRQWAEALLNMPLTDPGFELDTDVLVGRKARAVVSVFAKKNGGEGHQVNALLALAGSGAAMSPGASAAKKQAEEFAAQFGAGGYVQSDEPPF